MKKISIALMTITLILFFSGNSLAKTSQEIIQLNNGKALAYSPFYLSIEKLYPKLHYTVYCDMVNYSNEVITFSISGDGIDTYYAATYLDNKAFAIQSHLPPGKHNLKVDWVAYYKDPYLNRNIVINNADQAKPILLRNCYAARR